jgi:hypothetical protein
MPSDQDGGLFHVQPGLSSGRGKRLKGLDEFEKPEFVGRMEQIERRRKLQWYAMLAAAMALGAAIGLAIV